MNSVNAAFGFRPTRTMSGAPANETMNPYPIASAYNTAIYTGDPVTMLSDGTIGIGVAGSPCLGIFAGVNYQVTAPQANGNSFIFSPYWPASQAVKTGTIAYANIIDSPDMVFEVQESDASGNAGTPLALADVNLNVNFLIRAGNAATGQSQSTINNASENTTPTLNMKILGLAPFPSGVNPVGNFAVWLVTWNNHLFKGGAGTTGI